MRVFLAAAEEGNFTRASIRENISQPATTVIINYIEQTVGYQLFKRRGATRTAKLNTKGKDVAETFSRIVGNYDSEIYQLAEVNLKYKEVQKIMVQTAFAEGLSKEWLEALNNTFSSNQFRVEISSRKCIIGDIVARKAVLGIVDGEVDNRQVDYAPIGSYKVAMVVPENCWDSWSDLSEGVTWANIPEGAFIMSGMSCDISRQIHDKLKASGLRLNTFNEIGSLHIASSMAWKASMPIIMPAPLVAALPKDLIFRAISFKLGEVQAGIGIITPWGHMSRLKLTALRNPPWRVSSS